MTRRPCYRCPTGLVHLPAYHRFGASRGTRCETSPHLTPCYHPTDLTPMPIAVVTCLWCLTTPVTCDYRLRG